MKSIDTFTFKNPLSLISMRACPMSTELVHLLCIRGEYLNSCFSVPYQSELYNSAYPQHCQLGARLKIPASILILSSAVRRLTIPYP